MNQKHTIVLAICVALISIVSELIGTVKLHLGPGTAVLFPLVWAILLGGFISVQKMAPLKHEMQHTAGTILEVGIMIFIVRLGTLIGPHIGSIYNVGWALAFQELGHVFGTVILVLPLAVFLKMGRSSIGATYSIDREPNLAYMAERYGGDSDEYRGALAVYVIGSIFGALYIALLAGFLGSARIFDPIALAMGSGVGSGSMMAAASAAIAIEFPAHKEEILAIAGASNLITEVIGVYVTVFISLPLAERLYRFWVRIMHRGDVEHALVSETASAGNHQAAPLPSAHGKSSIGWIIQTSVIFGVIMLISNYFNAFKFGTHTLLGMLFLVVITILSFAVKRVIPQIPAIVWASLAGILLTAGHTPIAASITGLVKDIDFLAMVTPVLAYAGLSLGKDIPMLRKLGPRFIVVSLAVYTATYLCATAIAELLI
jgi:hypothetical protein